MNLLKTIFALGSVHAIYAAAWFWSLGIGNGAFLVIREHALYMISVAVCATVLLALHTYTTSKSIYTVAAAAAASALAIATLVDLAFLRFFKAPFWEVYPHLPVNLKNVTLGSLKGYISGYISVDLLLATAGIVLATISLVHFLRIQAHTALYASSVIGIGISTGAWLPGGPGERDVRFWAEFDARPPSSAVPLVATNCKRSIVETGVPLYKPRTILIIIMESAGRSIPSSDGNGLLRDRLVSSSKTLAWVDFGNAVTNSNATDVSIPSMITGAGAHEPVTKLQAMPFLMDLASVRGYRTALITSSTLKWANFDSFFEGAAIDINLHAETFKQPFINDATIDDAFAFRAASELVLLAEDDIFLTLYSNSLHWPFQQNSQIQIPATIKDRRSRAAFIQESGFSMLQEALRKSDRLEDALIIVVGDHGEFDYRVGSPFPITRVQTFESGILAPVFMWKLPANLPGKYLDAVRNNQERLVSSIDIAPSIAHLLGLSLGHGLTYAGFSLFQAIPEDRIALSTATNEWRSWTKTSVAVSERRDRMTCEALRLCLLQLDTASGLRLERQAVPEDKLFRIALSDPLMRRNIAKIYRDHFGLQ